jgi:hypothetical protein
MGMRRHLWPRDVISLLTRMLVFDLLANLVAPKTLVDENHDRIEVPQSVRPWLNPLKTAAVGGLLLGRRFRPLTVVTSLSLVGYFIAAFEFHRRAKDNVLYTAPAVAYGAVSAAAVVASTRGLSR